MDRGPVLFVWMIDLHGDFSPHFYHLKSEHFENTVLFQQMINIETFHRTPVRGRLYALCGTMSTELPFGITESFRAVADAIYLPLHFD